MTYSTVIFVLCLVLFGVILFIYKHWPRDENGEMMDPEEVKKFLEKFNAMKPDRDSKTRVLLFFVFIALLAIAVGKAIYPVDGYDNFKD